MPASGPLSGGKPYALAIPTVRALYRCAGSLTTIGIFALTARERPVYRTRLALAGWQSGHAEDCKSLDVGSIPAPASIFQTSVSQG